MKNIMTNKEKEEEEGAYSNSFADRVNFREFGSSVSVGITFCLLLFFLFIENGYYH